MPSDTDGEDATVDEWDQKAAELLAEVDDHLADLERGADGPKQQAVEEGRDLLAELADTLGEATDRDGFEQYKTVDISEAEKRP